MKLSSAVRQWLSPQRPNPPEPRGDPRVQTYFLVDELTPVRTQQCLAALDLLSSFNATGSDLPLTVVHRQPPTPEALELFDSTPRLCCTHLRGDALTGGTGSSAMLGHQWRDFVALALAGLTEADFYLVLDPTAMCIRPLDPKALIEEGLAVTQWESADLHTESTAVAQALVGLDEPPSEVLSTFPFVLSRPLAQKALQRVESHGGRPALECILEATAANQPWTANALYSCAAGSTLSRHHRATESGGVRRALHGDANVWDDSTELSDWNPASWRNLATHGHFLVIQGSDPQRMRKALSKCYELVHL